jgi:hypothetical protein
MRISKSHLCCCLRVDELSLVEELFTNKLVTLGPYTFPNNFVLGKGRFGVLFFVFFFFFFLFLLCSHQAPKRSSTSYNRFSMFPSCSPIVLHFYGTCFWPKLNFHVYKRGPKGMSLLLLGGVLVVSKK